MFLLFGEDKALLLDSGAGGVPIYNTVQSIIATWLAAHGKTSIPLVVAHTHSHGDHIAGDAQFNAKPNTTVVGTSTNAVIAFFGFQNWPNDLRQYDLGGRVLDVLGIPGHQASHIAIYDHQTALLFTGDTLYPGFLFISGAVSQGNFTKYKASTQRLVDFIADKPVAWVFGNHVEMKNTPGQSYPYGTNNQPFEHDPQLLREHLLELNAAVQAMGNSPHVEVHDDFIIQPSG
jgi:glyoxylase-like metal-dependent hydrolase (beta-lactamase superfamily II)